MALAIFDLDNTLIAGDSDHLWGDYLIELGVVDGGDYKASNDQFYQDYLRGELDIDAYLQFALAPLSRYPLEQLYAWREGFIRDKIRPIMLPAASELLDRHRAAGDTLLIITATNDFVTEPIADALGVANLIATRAERGDQRYTGRVLGVPSYREGKVTRLQDWLAATGQDLVDSWFYSDSHNDLPLLRQVSHPVAVDPDDSLRVAAEEQGWPIISLRDAVSKDQQAGESQPADATARTP